MAVVGLSPDEKRPSHRVARAMQRYGFRIVPVRPRLDSILGEKAVAELRDLPGPVDLVNVFRQGSAIDDIVDACLALGLPRLWIQEGIVNSPAARRAREFVALGEDLAALLTPYGVIRPDWQSNADTLAGLDTTGAFSNNRGLFSGALSWQSMMPRWGHDAVARVFLRHGGQLWFLRTNMAGGDDPRIEPIPPTGLMGGIPVVGTVAQRLADAFVTWPQPATILLSLLGLGLYGAARGAAGASASASSMLAA
jgi:predicted CoA-binding protein